MPKNLDLKQLGKFMDQTFSGRLNEEKIAPIRDLWKGKCFKRCRHRSRYREKLLN